MGGGATLGGTPGCQGPWPGGGGACIGRGRAKWFFDATTSLAVLRCAARCVRWPCDYCTALLLCYCTVSIGRCGVWPSMWMSPSALLAILEGVLPSVPSMATSPAAVPG